MLKHSILIFLGFIALASALDFTPEKNFFILPYGSKLSNQLFQTRNGIVAYSVDLMANSQYLPHYTQINLETNNVTEILQDLPSACGQGPSAYDRLTYHVLTYSLVYYCTNNNSILIIDPKSYEVKNVFSVSITQTFDEVRLQTEGYNVAILGLSGVLSQNPGPSHLIKVSLQTMQIVNHVVFDHALAAGEFVSAYGTNGNFFIMTNIINSTINIANIYAMTLIGNSYSLTNLATFNSSNSSYPNTLPEFYVNKNLIVTNNAETLVVLEQSGNILHTQGPVSLNQFRLGSYPNITFLFRPSIVSYAGSGDVHVLLQNTTLLGYTPQNQGFNVENEGNYRTIALAIQDQLTDTLLFTFTGPNDNFQIQNGDDLKYESVANFTNFMITDKTYAALSLNYLLEIFDIETNTLIQAIQGSKNSFYDQESSTFSFLVFDGSNYQLHQVDLRTGNVYNTTVSASFPTTDVVQLVHATNNENFNAPQYVIHDINNVSDSFLIVSQTFGQVHLTLGVPSSDYLSTLAVDYDTLTAYYFVNDNETTPVTITEYNYVSSNNSLVSNTTQQSVVNGNFIPATDFTVTGTPGEIAVIDMSSLTESDFGFSKSWTSFSTLRDSTNGFNVVLSQAAQWGSLGTSQSAGILYNKQVENLPGTTTTTVQAGAAGKCLYWVLNQAGCFGNVQVYNICNSGDNIFEITA